MKKNKLSMTVAIPAWNEERTIVDLLCSIKAQKHTNHKVDSVWVYSDGSTDRTVELVGTNFKDVKVVNFKKNLGKNVRINQIMQDNKSDILIQVDADIIIKDNRTFNYLIDPFIKDNKVGISCAYHLANMPTSFVGKLSYFGFRIWDRARNSLGKRGVRYYCEGGLRAFSKEFAKDFRLPVDKYTGEDSYSFYYAIENDFKVVVSKKAKAYIDLAESYKDYVRQMKRFLLETGLMHETFGKRLTEKFETMTVTVKLRALVYELIKSPLLGFCYLLLQMITRVYAAFYKPPKSWIPIERK